MVGVRHRKEKGESVMGEFVWWPVSMVVGFVVWELWDRADVWAAQFGGWRGVWVAAGIVRRALGRELRVFGRELRRRFVLRVRLRMVDLRMRWGFLRAAVVLTLVCLPVWWSRFVRPRLVWLQWAAIVRLPQWAM